MKHGLRPRVKQKIIIKNAGLNPKDWLFVKNLPNELWIVHRETEQQKSIKY